MADNFQVLKTTKSPCKIYTGVSLPAEGAEMTLTNGEPDATENPNALHLGLTDDGAVLLVEVTTTEEFFDEFKEALEETVDARMFKITANLSQVLDFDVLEQVLNGAATRADDTGIEKFLLGEKALTTTGAAVIFPTKADPTKYAVFHLYKASFKTNISTPISRQNRGNVPVEILGLAIPGRAVAESTGSFWQQV